MHYNIQEQIVLKYSDSILNYLLNKVLYRITGSENITRFRNKLFPRYKSNP